MRLSLLKLHRVWLATILAVVAMLAVLVSGKAPWIGDELWGQEVVGRAQLLILPLLSAFGAWWGRKDSQGIWTLLGTPRLRRRHLLHVVGAQAVGIMVVFAVGHAGVIGVGRLADLHFGNGSIWPFLTQTSAAILAFVTGYALGLVIASTVAVVTAAALWPLLILGEKIGLLAGALTELGASGTMLGYEPDPLRFGLRAVWLSAVVAVVLVVAVHERNRLMWTAVALVVLALGNVLIPRGDGFRTAAVPEACVGQPIQICGPRDIRPRLIQAAIVVNEAGEVLAGHGVRTPQKYVAWSAKTDSDHENWVRVFSPGRIREQLTTTDLVSDVVTPRSCALGHGDQPPSEAWMNGADLVAARVRAALASKGTAGSPTPTPSAPSVPSGTVGTVDESVVWQMAAALQDCDESAVPAEIPGARE